MKHPELLVPASSFSVLKVAVRYGADAVYIGGEEYGLRAKAKNFTDEEMKAAVGYAHERSVKVYVTANIFAHNSDLDGAREYFRFLEELRPDGILVADPGMLMLAAKLCPDVDLHISTQANSTNYETCLFWKELGVKRVVLARELSVSEIREIREHLDAGPEIEAFVHGAMCISYSGRCLLSNYFAGRDANHGECTHPCRWEYALTEMTRPGQYLPVEENERGTFLMNSKDLCMVDHLPDLYAAGIDSFKIEGRMKNALYVATVARTYKKAMEDFEQDPGLYEKNLAWYQEQIRECTYRPFSTGFFYGKPNAESQIYDSNTYVQGCTFLGTVEGRNDEGQCLLTQKNKFSVGEEIEIMKPDGRDLKALVKGIFDDDGTSLPSAPHPLQHLSVELETEEEPEQYDILRRRHL